MSHQPANPNLVWRKSSTSGGGNCVEVASLLDGVAVRDSKNHSGPMLTFDKAAWSSFIAGVRGGEFEGSL